MAFREFAEQGTCEGTVVHLGVHDGSTHTLCGFRTYYLYTLCQDQKDQYNERWKLPNCRRLKCDKCHANIPLVSLGSVDL